MVRFVARRLAAGVVLLFVVSALSFLLLHAAAPDPVGQILGPGASAQQLDRMRGQLGLNEPLLTQFVHWLSGMLHGNLGVSWFTGQPVSQAIRTRLPVTLSLVIGTTIVTAVISAILGVSAAVRGGLLDRVVQLIAVLGIAIPGFLVAIALINVFALRLHWFDPTGYTSLSHSATGWLKSVTLPVVGLSAGAMAGVVPQVRGAVVDVLGQDWVRTLRSRGIGESRVIYKHVLRNAVGPALTVIGVQFIGLLGGVVIIEELFAIPGIGQLSVSATLQGDVPLVMGVVVTVAVIVVVVNLLVDIVQGILNPKARMGERSGGGA